MVKIDLADWFYERVADVACWIADRIAPADPPLGQMDGEWLARTKESQQ